MQTQQYAIRTILYQKSPVNLVQKIATQQKKWEFNINIKKIIRQDTDFTPVSQKCNSTHVEDFLSSARARKMTFSIQINARESGFFWCKADCLLSSRFPQCITVWTFIFLLLGQNNNYHIKKKSQCSYRNQLYATILSGLLQNLPIHQQFGKESAHVDHRGTRAWILDRCVVLATDNKGRTVLIVWQGINDNGPNSVLVHFSEHKPQENLALNQ